MGENTLNDSRIEKILHLIMELAYGNLEAREKPSDNYDELDGIIGGLNMLAEELQHSTVSRNFLGNILNSMIDGLIIVDTDLIIQELNPSVETLTGQQKSELLGKQIGFIYPEEPEFSEYLIHQLPEKGLLAGRELTCISKYNKQIPTIVSAFPIHDNENQIQNYIFTIQNIAERKEKDEELRIAAVTFDTNEGILITDSKVNIIRVNQAFQDITGYSVEDVLGKNPSVISSGRHNESFYREMWEKLQQTGLWSGEIWNRRKSGQVYPEWLTITAINDKDENVSQYVAIFSDITKRKQAEDEIRSLAFYDVLTGLPNRRLLLDRFRIALSQSDRSKKYGAVMFLDLDKFKSINDMKGHEYGDLLLVEVAKRISSCLREMDTVARLGGDEFVILIEEVSADKKIALQRISLVAEKIRTVLAVPYRLKEYNYYSSASIGVFIYQGTEKPLGELLKSADMAMYQAKESGRNTIRFFDPIMQNAVEKHATLELNLRKAIEKNQFRLFFQIQVDREGAPIGAEALIRWQDPELGLILPDQFIPIAEESNLILEIGEWVLEGACRQLNAWSKNPEMSHMTLSVNVSARQFALDNFVESMDSILRTYKIQPSRLKLELTEHILLNNVNEVVTKMHELKALGLELSIDDFGTGYSSLSYLKQLPINQLKIDQSFVHDIATDANDAMMVKTIISLGQNFHLNVIAEGVETNAQLNFLIQNGCMASQGYLFGKPVPIEDFEQMFAQM